MFPIYLVSASNSNLDIQQLKYVVTLHLLLLNNIRKAFNVFFNLPFQQFQGIKKGSTLFSSTAPESPVSVDSSSLSVSAQKFQGGLNISFQSPWVQCVSSTRVIPGGTIEHGSLQILLLESPCPFVRLFEGLSPEAQKASK